MDDYASSRPPSMCAEHRKQSGEVVSSLTNASPSGRLEETHLNLVFLPELSGLSGLGKSPRKKITIYPNNSAICTGCHHLQTSA